MEQQFENEFITYNSALRLCKLGFDSLKREPCLAYFNTSNSNCDLESKDWWCLPQNDFQYALSAPTYAQSFKWFRDKYHLYGRVATNSLTCHFIVIENVTMDGTIGKSPRAVNCKSYEEAERLLLDELIKLVEDYERE